MDSISPEQSPPASSGLRRFAIIALTNPITRIIVGIVAIACVTGLTQAMLKPLRIGPTDGKSFGEVTRHLIGAVLLSAAILGTYALFVRLYEKRWPAEIGPRRFLTWWVSGLAMGIALMLTAWLTLWLGGWVVVESVAPSDEWAGMICVALASNLVVGCVEEILLRGLIFRIVEEVMGSWFSLAFSAILFGFAHFGNPNANWETSVGIAIQAGILLGALYMVTRSLWLPIAVHCGWNAMQQGIVGGALSGNKVEAILTTVSVGSERFSGGAFGIEGSVFTTIICGLTGVTCCVIAVRQKKTIKGRWLTKQSNLAS